MRDVAETDVVGALEHEDAEEYWSLITAQHRLSAA